jgi:phage baseplate assembly protein W
MAHVTTPHFSLPFRIQGEKGAAHCEQDSEEEVLYCIEAILRYPIGHRPERPEFGTPDLTFSEGNADERRIQDALNVWEPRVEMFVSQSEIDSVDELVQRIKVEAAKFE